MSSQVSRLRQSLEGLLYSVAHLRNVVGVAESQELLVQLQLELLLLALWVKLTADSLKCRKKDHCTNLEDSRFVFGPAESDVASVFASLFSILGVG